MSFLERARQAAEQAAKTAAEQGSKAAARMDATIRDPATKARAQAAMKRARRGLTTVLERIDPGVLADVVIKATSLQERANAKLREKGSVYRISEIGIGASIPPSVTFTISRVEDPEADAKSSLEILAAASPTGGAEASGADHAVVSLDGTTADHETLDELTEDEEA
jgi:hypothetical protein